MATQAKDSSPLLTYEADEQEGRKAFLTGKESSDCPFPSTPGGSIRRKAWMTGYFSEKYWVQHQFRSGWDE